MRLENAVKSTLPCRPGLHLLTLAVDEIPIELTTAAVDVHLSDREPSGTLPEVTADPEKGDDEQGKVSREELLSSSKSGANRRDSGIELLSIS